MQRDFIYINKPHLVLTIRAPYRYFLHLFHTPIDILNIHLYNVLNG